MVDRVKKNPYKDVPLSASFTMSFEADTLPTYRKSSFVALWVETLLYGIYAVLFGICIYIFHGRKQSQNVVLMVAAVIMFALSTAHLITVFITTFNSVLYPQNGMASERVALASGHLYVTNNIIADGLIVYRCYIVWGSNKYIIVLPTILLLTTAVIGYTFRITIELISLSLATSITATGLTAWRIWHIACQAREALGRSYAKRYNTAFAIVLESGAIYSISLIIFLVVYNNGPGSQTGISKVTPAKYAPINSFPYYFPASYIVYVSVTQIMGIVSTLIVVRVGLGLSMEDVESLPAAREHRVPGPGTITRPPVVSIELSTVVFTSSSSSSDAPKDVHKPEEGVSNESR